MVMLNMRDQSHLKSAINFNNVLIKHSCQALLQMFLIFTHTKHIYWKCHPNQAHLGNDISHFYPYQIIHVSKMTSTPGKFKDVSHFTHI